MFKKQKTGSLAFNVEYTLSVLRCKKRALTDEELQIVESAQSIDELVPRLTADEQKKFIEENILDSAKSDEEVPEEMQESVDDIPY